MTTDDFEKGIIVGLHVAGVSVRDITNHCCHSVKSKTTVQAVIADFDKKKKKAKKASPSPTDKRIAERRRHAAILARKVTKLGERSIPTCGTAKRIAAALAAHKGIKASPRTIRRDLNALGFRCLVRPKVSGMTTANKKARLEFCTTFKQRYAQSYAWPRNTNPASRVVFSDEHFITTNDSSCRFQWVHRKTELLARESKSRFNTKCLMIWAAIGFNYKSRLVVINTNLKDEDGNTRRLDQVRYQRMCLINSRVVADCAMRKLIFMQDGARCHIAKRVIKYIISKGCKHIDNWPAHSPELNPIEKLWAHLNQVVSENYPPATDLKQLEQQVNDAWKNKISQATINRFVLNFESGLDACRNNGGMPK